MEGGLVRDSGSSSLWSFEFGGFGEAVILSHPINLSFSWRAQGASL